MSARLVRSHMRQMVAYLLWSCSLVAGPRSLAHGYAPCAAAACDAQLGRMIFGQTKNLTARSSRPRAHQLNLDLHNPFSRKNLWCVCVCVCVCDCAFFQGQPSFCLARPVQRRRRRDLVCLGGLGGELRGRRDGQLQAPRGAVGVLQTPAVPEVANNFFPATTTRMATGLIWRNF